MFFLEIRIYYTLVHNLEEGSIYMFYLKKKDFTLVDIFSIDNCVLLNVLIAVHCSLNY